MNLRKLCSPDVGFDHNHRWVVKSSPKVAVVMTEPYEVFAAKRARDHLRILGFEARPSSTCCRSLPSSSQAPWCYRSCSCMPCGTST